MNDTWPTLDRVVRIRVRYRRSINLIRDQDSLEAIKGYLPTSRALEALQQIIRGLAGDSSGRAHALIGPYGSGKSAFALFLGAILSEKNEPLHRAAAGAFEEANPSLAKSFEEVLGETRGFLKIQISGTPDSLIRQLMSEAANTASRYRLGRPLIKRLQRAAQPGFPMNSVLELIEALRASWKNAGGAGILIEIDELGKFLEYESNLAHHHEIHLLQILAEKAAEEGGIPILLVVLLHQSFEQYGHRLGRSLRHEWQKIQGRFATIAFLEPVEQTLQLLKRVLVREHELPLSVREQVANWTKALLTAGVLPPHTDEDQARDLFESCYPLHPITLLVLPALCQKVAQNERTLFSYFAGMEEFGLQQRLADLRMGEWVGPWELYDYFLLNQPAGLSDPVAYHRWVEIATALNRFEPNDETSVTEDSIRLIKTIGLLNLIGATRGLRASIPVLNLSLGDTASKNLEDLERLSIVYFRRFSGEYRLWQGSDFDLRGALKEVIAEHSASSLADTLNTLQPLMPVVARRASIETGALRAIYPFFASRAFWPPEKTENGELRLFFYLSEDHERDRPDIMKAPEHAVVAICGFTERLREVVSEWMSLRDLPNRYAALHEDPVAIQEHRLWLSNAEIAARKIIRSLIDEPERLDWFIGGTQQEINNHRELQEKISQWVMERCFPDSPILQNELINREHPSPSAASARRKLITAMLTAADKDDLGIEKTPAEKSLYLSVLKATRLHCRKGGVLGFFSPDRKDDPNNLSPCWNRISEILGTAGERQVPLAEIYAELNRPPFGVRSGVLPILTIAYYLAHRREVALYQEGAFCEMLTPAQAELLSRRPTLFAMERFELKGLRGDLFQRYQGTVVGRTSRDATVLDIAKPLLRFIAKLPESTANTSRLSPEARRVLKVFRQAKSPGKLLFSELPKALGETLLLTDSGDQQLSEQFVNRLTGVLRELNSAYPRLLGEWTERLGRVLVGDEDLDLQSLRRVLGKRYEGLDRFTAATGAVAQLLSRLTNSSITDDRKWLESVLSLLAEAPPRKWKDLHCRRAELDFSELKEQIKELEFLRQRQPDSDRTNGQNAILLSLIEPGRRARRIILHPSEKQRMSARERAGRIAERLKTLDVETQRVVIAELLERLAFPSTDPRNNDDE